MDETHLTEKCPIRSDFGGAPEATLENAVEAFSMKHSSPLENGGTGKSLPLDKLQKAYFPISDGGSPTKMTGGVQIELLNRKFLLT